MKKILSILAFAIALLLCSCKKEYVDPFTGGVNIGQTFVGAKPGSVSVLVNTAGTWRVSCDQPWISFDVDGGKGKAAFTVNYESNESGITSLRASRVAKIAIGLDNTLVADTLTITQQGFLSIGPAVKIVSDPNISVEFDQRELRQMSLICCSLEGVSPEQQESAISWACSQADVCVIGSSVYNSVDDINVAGFDFTDLDTEAEYKAFKNLIDTTLNAGLGTGNWILCGQTNHLSMMQIGYPSTPSWYPTDANDPVFDSDRFAWQNNLYEMLWMKEQNYVETYTDDDRSYQADYMYVSSTLLSNVTDMEIISAEYGMSHTPLIITLIY